MAQEPNSNAAPLMPVGEGHTAPLQQQPNVVITLNHLPRYFKLDVFSWPAITTLQLIFAVLLWNKIDGTIPASESWANVFIPSFVSDGLIILGKLVLIYDAHTQANAVPQIQQNAILAHLQIVVFKIGEVVSKILIIARLNGFFLDMRVVVTPILAVTILQVLISGKRHREFEGKKPTGGNLFAAIGAILIALRIEGHLSSTWQTAFAPIWLVIATFALLCAMMSCFVPCLASVSARSIDGRLVGFLCFTWAFLVTGVVCSCIALARLGSRLEDEYNGDVSSVTVRDIFVPIVVLLAWAIAFALGWAGLLLSIASNPLQPLPNTGAGANGQPSSALIQSINSHMASFVRPTALVRMSSTYFRRADTHDVAANGTDPVARDLEAGLDADTDDERLRGKTCYICCEAPSNGVLMECGHGGLCVTCGKNLRDRYHPCPICREVIVEVLTIEPVEGSNVVMVAKA
eukprot:GILK01002747.1.p1 GENE.GILK01002747.1~~GILK01002747.1.p1  ORF type:complete len:495 (-),score=51.70 GILK01002747.1:260-1642(-)